MLKVLEKEILTNDDINKLDAFFNEDNISKLLEADNKNIIRYIDESERLNGFSLVKEYLKDYLYTETIDLKSLFEEDKLEYCKKVLDLIYYFHFDDFGLAYFMGDYFLNLNDKEKALKYFKLIFKKGFDLSNYGYYYSLERYINLIDNKTEVLKEIILNSNPTCDYELDYLNTYLLLIVNLEKYSDEYIEFIDKGIKEFIPIIRKMQDPNRSSISDSDEERNLCELIALKMEYYVYKKDYIEAYKAYNQLTEEIVRSDCMRYYHARDRFYNQMLSDMSEEYKELKFFEDIGYYEFKVLDDNVNLSLNSEITLGKSNGLTFKFVISNVYEDEITIKPILPLLGLGGCIFTKLVNKDDGVYLVNKLSH